jgi:hypothetical protein
MECLRDGALAFGNLSLGANPENSSLLVLAMGIEDIRPSISFCLRKW